MKDIEIIGKIDSRPSFNRKEEVLALIIDGRNSFGVEWGGIDQEDSGGTSMSAAESTAPCSGEVSQFDASNLLQS